MSLRIKLISYHFCMSSVQFKNFVYKFLYCFCQSLYSSIVAVGGCSLLNGFVDRLSRDLTTKTPPVSLLKYSSYKLTKVSKPPKHFNNKFHHVEKVLCTAIPDGACTMYT